MANLVAVRSAGRNLHRWSEESPKAGRSLRPAPLALILLLAASLAAPQAKPRRSGKARPEPPNLVAQRIDAILAGKDASRLHWGIRLESLTSGKVLYSRNDRLLFTPASNAKLFTVAAALDQLGPDFRFRTTVETAQPPDRLGRISGDIVLVGRGDPNLSSRVLPFNGRTERTGGPLKALDLLADDVAQKGVRYVDGDVIADDTYFVYERYGEGWSQDDMLWWYGAPVSALSINDNVVFLQVVPGEKAGDPALVRLEPFEGYWRIENRVVTVDRPSRGETSPGGGEGSAAPERRRIFYNREPGTRTLEIWGRIPLGDSGSNEMLALEDPARFAAEYFHDALQRRGVVVYGQPRVRHRRAVDSPPPKATLAPVILASLESAPAFEDYRVVNKVSQNLHAELLLRTLGREKGAPGEAQFPHEEPGSVAAGLKVVKGLLARAGVPEDDYALFDGSGLSRQNLVSPLAVVQLLKHMHQSRHRQAWLDTLPVAGVDGSLTDRLKGPLTKGKVFAKTGSLGHVSALGGYATTASGETIAFSIFVNNHNLRGSQANRLIDSIVEAALE
jgi:D-alanyl-D-alanine carboxypeptidase/D-alanyl-D-alanine-endopeptidase (penicillin-binding protein 4)